MAEFNSLIRFKKQDGSYDTILPVSTTPNIIVDLNNNRRLDQELDSINLALMLKSAGTYEIPNLTNNGDGTILLGETDVLIYTNDNFNGFLELFTVPSTILSLNNNLLNFVCVIYNNASPIFSLVSDPSTINESNIIPIFIIYRDNNNLQITTQDALGKGLSNKIHKSIIKTQALRCEDGVILSETSNRKFIIGSGVIWYGTSRKELNLFNSEQHSCYKYYHTNGVWTKIEITQFDNFYYDNGANLVELTDGNYSVTWLYRNIEGPNIVYSFLGSADNSLLNAINSKPPINLPLFINSNFFLVGRVITRKNATESTQIDNTFTKFFSNFMKIEHRDLLNPNDLNAHVISSITGLQERLENIENNTPILKSTDYNITYSDKIIFFQSDLTTLNAYLPDVISKDGTKFTIKNIGIKNVIVQPITDQLIDGKINIILSTYSSFSIVSFNNNWYII